MDIAKKNAGYKAAEFVEDGMVVGLGSGSTVAYLLEALKGKDIIGVCTSIDTENKCKEYGIPTASINEKTPQLAIDGADEVSPERHLIKGGGGALTREKVIDYRAEKFIVIVGENKLVDYLGKTFYLPVEVLPFCWQAVKKDLEKKFEKVVKRDFTTDNNNYILDCYGKIENPVEMERELNSIPGVVENGIFTKKVYKVIVGKEDGADVID